MTTSTLQVRALRANEVQLVRELRLRALQESPEQFAESFPDANARSDAEWAQGAATLVPPSEQAAFIAELDGSAVGMVLALLDRSDARAGRLGGLWVDPVARRRGVGTALVKAVLDWAAAHAKEFVLLWATDDAPSAQSLYARAGFTQTGKRADFPGAPTRGIVEMRVVVGPRVRG